MPLDLDCTDPMYLLGRVVATIEGAYPDGRRVTDGPEIDVLLVRPTVGFALLQKRFGTRMNEANVASMIEILPPKLPEGPVPIEAQWGYWAGYYHQRGQDQHDVAISAKFGPGTLRRVGEALYGPDHWQAEMARALGLGNSSRVRAWLTDNPETRRRVPAGICRDLLAMLRQKSNEARALAEELDRAGNPDVTN